MSELHSLSALRQAVDHLRAEERHWWADTIMAAIETLTRDDSAAEAIERVRALHYAANSDSARTPLCEECQGRAGVHPCGCWAEKDRQPVCGHCNAAGLGQRVPWPCPTFQALDGVE